jgi:hypothetical protein
MLFLVNPAAWHSRYVLGIHDQKTNPAALVGSAMHKYLELKCKGFDGKLAFEEAKRIVRGTDDVDWGKTGNVEKALNDLTLLVLGYADSPYDIGEIIAVENRMFGKPKGIRLPIKAYVDLIHERDGQLIVTDWKTVRVYDTEPTPAHMMQAAVYYYATENKYRRKPKAFEVVQIKASKNADGGPQTKVLRVVYAERQREMRALKKLINHVITEMRRKRKAFLPNLRDGFDGDKTFSQWIEKYGQP